MSTSPRATVIWNKRFAIAWVITGVLAFVFKVHDAVWMVWIASVYANAKTDWSIAEAADDSAILKELKELRSLVEGMMSDSKDEEYQEEPAEKLYTGLCLDGPMQNREEITVRFPKGFVCVDKDTDSAWVYVYDEETETFSLKDGMTRELSIAKAEEAATGSEYDVVVLP